MKKNFKPLSAFLFLGGFTFMSLSAPAMVNERDEGTCTCTNGSQQHASNNTQGVHAVEQLQQGVQTMTLNEVPQEPEFQERDLLLHLSAQFPLLAEDVSMEQAQREVVEQWHTNRFSNYARHCFLQLQQAQQGSQDYYGALCTLGGENLSSRVLPRNIMRGFRMLMPAALYGNKDIRHRSLFSLAGLFDSDKAEPEFRKYFSEEEFKELKKQFVKEEYFIEHE